MDTGFHQFATLHLQQLQHKHSRALGLLQLTFVATLSLGQQKRYRYLYYTTSKALALFGLDHTRVQEQWRQWVSPSLTYSHITAGWIQANIHALASIAATVRLWWSPPGHTAASIQYHASS